MNDMYGFPDAIEPDQYREGCPSPYFGSLDDIEPSYESPEAIMGIPSEPTMSLGPLVVQSSEALSGGQFMPESFPREIVPHGEFELQTQKDFFLAQLERMTPAPIDELSEPDIMPESGSEDSKIQSEGRELHADSNLADNDGQSVSSDYSFRPIPAPDFHPFPEMKYSKPYNISVRSTLHTRPRCSSRMPARGESFSAKWKRYERKMRRVSLYSRHWRESVYGTQLGRFRVSLPFGCPECNELLSKENEWTHIGCTDCRFAGMLIEEILEILRQEAFNELLGTQEK